MRNKTLTFAAKLMELKNITLTESCQTLIDRKVLHVYCHMYNPKSPECKIVINRGWEPEVEALTCATKDSEDLNDRNT